jgi:hypothetical protein
VRPVWKVARAHAREQLEVLGHRTVAVRAVATRFRQGAAVSANLVGIEAIDVRLAVTNQSDGKLVQALEVVRGEIQAIPLKAEPLDVLFDGVDVLDVLLRGVRVVEPEVAGAVGFFGDAEIETD